MNNQTNLQTLLLEWNKLVLESPLRLKLPLESQEQTWLGRTRANEAEIRNAETSFQRKLPPSYRSFLEFSNGWNGYLVYDIVYLLSVDKIALVTDTDPKLIASWPDLELPPISDAEYLDYPGDEMNFRPQYLRSCIKISSIGDICVLLLNPEIVDANGEWEAWLFAPWIPGAIRYPSFKDMVAAHFVWLQNAQKRASQLNTP